MCEASRGVVNKTNAASECASSKVLLPDRITTGPHSCQPNGLDGAHSQGSERSGAAGSSDWIEGDVLRRYVALIILFFSTQGGKCSCIRT